MDSSDPKAVKRARGQRAARTARPVAQPVQAPQNTMIGSVATPEPVPITRKQDEPEEDV